MPYDSTTIQRWTTQLETRWNAAHAKHDNWDALIKRQLRPVTDPKMGSIGAGADYRTSLLEKELKRIIGFLAGATWDFEGKAGKDSPTGKDEAKNAQLWFAAWWAAANRGGWINEQQSAGQAVPGVDAIRLLTRNLEEPDEDVDRDEWMQTRDQVWYFRDVPTKSVYWDPVDSEYTRIVMDYELSVAEAKESFKVDGKDIGMEKGKTYTPIHERIDASGIGWSSDDEAVDESQADAQDKKIRVTVVEYRDSSKPCPICPDKHPLWVGAEYVRDSSVENLKDAKQVKEYVLPYKLWPSLRICEGETWPGQSDPEWRFRPMLFDMLNEAMTLNWINGLINAVANFDMTRGDLLKLNTQIPDNVRDELKLTAWPLTPNTVDDKADVVPGEPVRWPAHLTAELIEVADRVEARMQAARINPILFGEYTEAVKPATTDALLLRQARAPFDRPLKKQAQFIIDCAEDIMHAILYYDHDAEAGTEQRYYVSLLGDEGGTPGEKVYMSASKLGTRPKVYVSANAEQLAEQQARWDALWMGYAERGIYDFDQVLEGYGFKDTEAQNARLDLDRQRRQLQPMLDNAMLNYALQISADIMETDPMLLTQNPFAMAAIPQPGAPGGGGGGSPAPTVRPPALQAPNSGPSPTGGP